MQSGDTHEFARQITNALERIARLEKDAYYGNGKPGMTTRIQSLEECADRLEREVQKMELNMKEQLARFDRRTELFETKMDSLSRYVWMGVGILLAAEVALKVLFH